MRILVTGLARTGTSAAFWLIREAMPQGTVALFEPETFEVDSQQDLLLKLLTASEPVEPFMPLLQLAVLCPKVIVLHRDPRDTLVSTVLFLMHHVLPQTSGLIDEYAFGLQMLRLKEKRPAVVMFAPCFEQVMGWHFGLERRDACAWWTQRYVELQMLCYVAPQPYALRYEDLITGDTQALSEYLGLPLGALPEPERTHASIKRAGRIGDWRHWFTPADVAYFQPLLQPAIEAMGYDPAWTLADPQVIDPATSSRYVEKWWRVQRQRER